MDNTREREDNFKWKKNGAKGKTGRKSAQRRKDKLQQKTAGSKFAQGSVDTYNDVSWYAKNSSILADAASYSYNQPVGSKLPTSVLYRINTESSSAFPTVTVTSSETKSSRTVPGVMNLYTGLLPGVSLNYQSPLNLAAQNIYSYVRYMNSGAKNYDPQDLMMYLLALDSAYACWNFYKRIYGLASSYSQSNWYLPKTLIETAGVDFDSVRSNLADFRMFLNVSAAKLTSFCTPATMPIFVRHSWMYSNVWADASNPKAQLYQFSPMYFYQYQENTNPQGGVLKPIPFCTFDYENMLYRSHGRVSQMSVEQMKRYLNALIDSLSLSEDIGVMSGDILKAYGQDKLFKLSSVEPEYVVTPVYNEEVLGQIHNATIVASHYKADDISSCVVTQNVSAGTIVCNPVFEGDRMEVNAVLVNSQKTSVSPQDTMVNTRLTAAWIDSVSGASATKHFTAVGSEFVYLAGMTFIDVEDPTRKPFIYGFKSHPHVLTYKTEDGFEPGTTFYNAMWNNVNENIVEYLEMDTMLHQFDWAPLVLPVLETITVGNDPNTGNIKSREYTFVGYAGDLSNWTVITADNLANLHLTALMSEFDIPQIGSF